MTALRLRDDRSQQIANRLSRRCGRAPFLFAAGLPFISFSTATSFAFASISTVIFKSRQHFGKSFMSMKS